MGFRNLRLAAGCIALCLGTSACDTGPFDPDPVRRQMNVQMMQQGLSMMTGTPYTPPRQVICSSYPYGDTIQTVCQ